MAWRTEVAGHAARICSNLEPFSRMGGEPHGSVIEPYEENAPERSLLDRRCPECGTRVCSYKDPAMKKVWCYAHDDMTPWTRPYLVGLAHVDRSAPCYNKNTERRPVE